MTNQQRKEEEQFEALRETNEPKYLKLWKRFSLAGIRIPNGARVVPTEWAIQNGVIMREDDRKYVKVKNRPNTLYSIYVRRENNKQPTSYWSGFWKKL